MWSMVITQLSRQIQESDHLDAITELSAHTSYTQNTAQKELLKETSLKTFYQRNRFPTEQDLPFRKLIKKFKSCIQ